MPHSDAGPPQRDGFTLIEAVTALGVFAIAAIALLHLGAQNAASLAAMQQSTYARIVGHNQLALAMNEPELPRLGESRGEERLARRDWRWTRTVARTADPDIVRIDVAVREGDDPRVAAEVTAFRGRQ